MITILYIVHDKWLLNSPVVECEQFSDITTTVVNAIKFVCDRR